MNAHLNDISTLWPRIESVFAVPHTEDEYDHLVSILDELIDEVGQNESHALAPVIETVGTLIENYETNHIEEPKGSPVEVIKLLMQEHKLKQSDIPEIGSKGVVSEILSGKRSLNLQQIKKLSHRFGVSPAAFI